MSDLIIQWILHEGPRVAVARFEDDQLARDQALSETERKKDKPNDGARKSSIIGDQNFIVDNEILNDKSI